MLREIINHLPKRIQGLIYEINIRRYVRNSGITEEQLRLACLDAGTINKAKHLARLLQAGRDGEVTKMLSTLSPAQLVAIRFMFEITENPRQK